MLGPEEKTVDLGPGTGEVVSVDQHSSLIKSYMRKCDWRLIPALSLTYLFK